MAMPAATAVAFIREVQRQLPLGFRWQQNFLRDVRSQLSSGFRKRLTAKQVCHVLIAANEAGVSLDDFTEVTGKSQEQGATTHAEKFSCP